MAPGLALVKDMGAHNCYIDNSIVAERRNRYRTNQRCPSIRNSLPIDNSGRSNRECSTVISPYIYNCCCSCSR
jgi:hypothetical protein